MKIKQSLCYPMLNTTGLSLDTLFLAASQTGYAAVETWFRGDDFEEIAARAKRHDLVLSSICGHQSLGDGLNNPANHDRIEDELKASIDIAVRHKIPGLICFSGNRRPGQSAEDALDAVVSGLLRVAPYAEKHDINLNMELLNSKVDHAGYLNDHTAWGVSVCERVQSPRVKLLYDIYHMQVMEGDVIRTLSENIRWIGHFHTAGNPGRSDLDDTQELYYPAICRAIVASGYDLYVGHEFKPKGDPLEALKSAFLTCNVN